MPELVVVVYLDTSVFELGHCESEIISKEAGYTLNQVSQEQRQSSHMWIMAAQRWIKKVKMTRFRNSVTLRWSRASPGHLMGHSSQKSLIVPKWVTTNGGVGKTYHQKIQQWETCDPLSAIPHTDTENCYLK